MITKSASLPSELYSGVSMPSVENGVLALPSLTANKESQTLFVSKTAPEKMVLDRVIWLAKP